MEKFIERNPMAITAFIIPFGMVMAALVIPANILQTVLYISVPTATLITVVVWAFCCIYSTWSVGKNTTLASVWVVFWALAAYALSMALGGPIL